jgi:cell division inhibitor SulA
MNHLDTIRVNLVLILSHPAWNGVAALAAAIRTIRVEAVSLLLKWLEELWTAIKKHLQAVG